MELQKQDIANSIFPAEAVLKFLCGAPDVPEEIRDILLAHALTSCQEALGKIT